MFHGLWLIMALILDRRPFSMGRDFHNAWRFYRSRLTGKPPVFL